MKVNQSRKGRKPKGSKSIRPATATFLMAVYMRSDSVGRESIELLLNPSARATPEQKLKMFRELASAIDDSAQLMAYSFIIEKLWKDRTPTALACSFYVLYRYVWSHEHPQEKIKQRTNDLLMEKVWQRIKDHKVVRKYLIKLHRSDDAETEVAKWKKGVRRKAIAKWAEVRGDLRRADKIKRILARETKEIFDLIIDAK